MTSQNNQARAIFLEAIEQDSTENRADFLERACRGKPDLRERVERLLCSHQLLGSFHDDRWSDAASVESPVTETAGDTIGPYSLRELLGEGGMGSVFVAEQEVPVRRKVALKIIKPGMDSRQVLTRFEAERQALALMDHPNIAKVLDAGTTESGRPYFVMELVRGVPITEFCDQRRLGPRQRLDLFIQVCRAIQHAHQKGVIHRDIKPSNILVTLHDELPVPKVIDFGIAKATGQRLTEQSVYTAFNQMIGTPLYMSPEQAEMNALDVDTRSDVYSLGVLLYELLTGSTPFDNDTFKQAGFDEMRRLIREVDPPRPSQRVSTLGANASTISQSRGIDERHLHRALRGDLDWIVMKCLEKDRSRRYESPSALVADVQKHLKDETVEACPPAVGYRVKKFARRHKGRLSIAALVLLALGTIGGLLAWMARDRAMRLVAIDQQLESALQTSVELQQVSSWSEALAVLKGTRTMVVQNAGSPTLLQQMEKRLAEVQMAIDLQEITLAGRTRDYGDEDFYLADPEIEREYARAFREFGIDAEQLTPSRAAELIRAKSIRAELVDGLEYWALYRAHSSGGNDPLYKRLLHIAGMVDDDPWRQQLRAAWLAESRRPEKLFALLPLANEQDRPMTPLMLGALPALETFGHTEEVVDLLRKVWLRHPDDFWVLFELGSASPDPEEAIRFCTAALAIRPQTAGLHYQLSAHLIRKKSYDAAIPHAREAIRLWPQFERAYLNLGQALAATGRRAEAITAFRAGIQVAPDFWETYLHLADALRDEGHIDEALIEYRKMINASPAPLIAHLKLWEELGRNGQSDRRLKAYLDALQLPPVDKQGVLENLGRHFLEHEQYADAEAVLRECVAASEKVPPHLAITVGRKSMLGAALLRQAVVLKTTDPGAAEAKLTEAEPLLVGSYAGLHALQMNGVRFDEMKSVKSLQRLVELYTAWDKPAEAAKWQYELDANAPNSPAENPKASSNQP